MNVKPLFKLMVEKKASDLFFAPFAPAKIKIEGKIMPVNKLEMTPKMVKQAAIELMDDDQLEFAFDLDQALFELYENATISYEEAMRNSDSKNELRLRVKLESKRDSAVADQQTETLKILEEDSAQTF